MPVAAWRSVQGLGHAPAGDVVHDAEDAPDGSGDLSIVAVAAVGKVWA